MHNDNKQSTVNNSKLAQQYRFDALPLSLLTNKFLVNVKG